MHHKKEEEHKMKKLKKKVHAQHKRVKKEEHRGEMHREKMAAGKHVKPSRSPGRGKRIVTKYKTHATAKKHLMHEKE